MALNADQITRSREVLLEKRSALLRQVERLAENAHESTESSANSRAPMSSAENASDTYEQEFAFISMESEEDILQNIDTALQRMRENAYGQCDECGKAIHPDRLEALPWATRCIRCQEREE